MKKRILCLLCALALCMGMAAAEEAPKTAQLEAELISAGAFPEIPAARTYAAAAFEEHVISQIKAGAEMIDVSEYGFTTEEDSLNALLAAYSNALNCNPELFYIGTTLRYSYYSDGSIADIYPQYLYTGEELETRIAAFESAVASIAAYASCADTDIGRLLAVNDYFCVNFQYDTSYSVYRPDLLFSGGTGVCQAYMLGYSAVLNELGIENTPASSDAMNHIWNMVQLDGSWYHVDVTWNDPTSDMPLRACHDHFLRSDSGITSEGHYSWSSAVSAASTAYDSAFWIDLCTPLGVYGEHLYYADAVPSNGQRTIRSWNCSTGETTALHTYSILRPDGTYGYYSGYSAIAADASNVYYGALDSLYAVPAEGGEEWLIDTAENGQEIRSCFRQGNTLRYWASDNLSSGAVYSAQITAAPAAAVVSPSFVQAQIGGEFSLSMCDAATDEALTGVQWSCDNEALSMGENGAFTALKAGVYTVQAEAEGYETAEATVVVHSADQFALPAGTKQIHAGAFINTAAEEIILPEGALSVEDGAFGSCTVLKMIWFPESVAEIASNAFEGTDTSALTILCAENSAAHAFALENGVSFRLIP